MRLLPTILGCIGVAWTAGGRSEQPAAESQVATSSQQKAAAVETPADSRPHAGVPLQLGVTIEFKREKPRAGAPTIHTTYHLKNLTPDVLYVDGYSFYWDMRLVSLTPKRLFRVEDKGMHALVVMRRRPPKRRDLWSLEPGATKTVRLWAWSGEFFVDKSKRQLEGRGRFFTYRQKKPGKARFRHCYFPRRFMLRKFLPAGGRPLHLDEPICAEDVTVNLASLPSVSL